MNFIKKSMICLLCFQNVAAQNLIPDSSFETNKSIPINFSAINLSNSWSAPTWGTTDLFCKSYKKGKQPSMVDVPQNAMGNQNPHSGSCYAGLFAFSHGNYREYLQTLLKTPLEKNKTYCFTMYISLADYSQTYIDQLGVCFLTHQAEYKSSEVITNLNPIYLKIDKQVVKDITNWYPVTITYKAYGGEMYVLLGSFDMHTITRTKFKAPKNIKSQINQSSERDAYYYIDDVSLFEISLNEIKDSVINTNPVLVDEISLDTSFVFKNVLFQTNKSTLLPSSYTELDFIVAYLNKNNQLQIEIIGHTDNSGNEKSNKMLSIQRAKSVVDYLIIKGIHKNRIYYNGYGSIKPIVINDSEIAKQQNRRVEFRIKEISKN